MSWLSTLTQGERDLGSLVFRNFLTSALIPLFVIELMLLVLYFAITLHVSGRNQATLLQEATASAREIASREVAVIDSRLQEVTRLGRLLQKDHQAFFAHPGDCVMPRGAPVFARHVNGAYYKRTDNGGASLYYSATTALGPEQLRKARCSEALDPLLESIVETSPLVTQAYLNTRDDMNRLYPYMKDAPAQYGPAIHMVDYNFYYEADTAHNPQRKPVWTGAYLDPAGQGWMVSLIVPVYRGDLLEGVSGLDVTIDSFVQNVLKLRMPWTASTLMVDGRGMILAMQESAEGILRLRELKGHVYDRHIKETINKPEEFNLLTRGDEAVRRQMADLFHAKARFGELRIDGVAYLVSQEIVPETGWRMISLIEKAHVLEPITRLKTWSDRVGFLAITGMALFYGLFFLYMLNKSRRLSRAIAQPISRLSELTHDLGVTLKAVSLAPVGIKEIDELGQHFNAMALELETRANSLMEAKRAAEAASQAKSIFLANMSHELRTPLNGIMGMTHLALRRAQDAKQSDQLEKVMRASQHLLALINDILDISNIEADRIVIERAPFTLEKVIDQLQNLVRPAAQEKGLSLRVNLPPDLAVRRLLGDAPRLGQILLNLCGNAVKFTERGGITLRVAILEDTGEDLLLRFEVEDTGIGIAPDDRDRLFNIFEQADGSSTRKHGGSGLGLAIGKRLSRMMGGDIGMDSEPGQGSTFWFTARLGKTTDVVEPREAIEPGHGG